ncbi:SRPBCC family protein [Streptomyces sp. t39]|uniref:SRPBCC family protein n=1 Tax=Streptomyces sp. t39 TaxID=1828156 RepID=UPI0011CEC608|nr:SRPBCC family protein [Streptomyces sp. t39]TXS52887.1 SRPBCC family protein [Streptomyces sp. t39]
MATKERDNGSGEDSGLERLRDELIDHLSARVEGLADKAGDKLAGLTDQLMDTAENGGPLPRAGLRVLKGDNPLKAIVGEKTKSIKDNVFSKVGGLFGKGDGDGDGGGGGGGGGGRKSGSTKVMNIVEVLDVGVPLRRAYDHWTQFEQFGSFTKGVRNVSKGDEVSSDWKVKVGPSTRGWKATVQEQIPDERIVWTSEGAKGTTRGCVSFHELAPELTRIVLVVEYYPSGFFEKTGNIWRAQGRRLRLDFKHFQRYVTLTEDEPEGWRGEIRDGEVVRSHEEAVEAEEAEEAEAAEGAEEEEGEGEGEEGDEEYADEDGYEDEEGEEGEEGEGEEGEEGDEDDEDDDYEEEEGDAEDGYEDEEDDDYEDEEGDAEDGYEDEEEEEADRVRR